MNALSANTKKFQTTLVVDAIINARNAIIQQLIANNATITFILTTTPALLYVRMANTLMTEPILVSLATQVVPDARILPQTANV